MPPYKPYGRSFGVSAKRVVQRLATGAFKRLQKWFCAKTAVQAEEAGAKLGRLVWRLSKKHRQRALENLERAFPDQTPEWHNEVGRGVLEHFGRVMADFVRAEVRTNQEVLDTVTVEGYENLEAALAKGKGVLLISGHIGNWERMGHWVSAKGYPVSVVARNANDPEMNEIVLRLRNQAGMDVIPRGDAIEPVRDRLAKNELVGLLPDQNSEEIFVPFFGHPCGTVKGPAVISRRYRAPLIPIYYMRAGPNQYHLIIEPALEPEPGYDQIEGLTRAINTSLERAIRRYPDQYLWIHNRWKSAKKRGLV
jgi:Kdo2-lipid IVA lauroyltransferase/acyltransferase